MTKDELETKAINARAEMQELEAKLADLEKKIADAKTAAGYMEYLKLAERGYRMLKEHAAARNKYTDAYREYLDA